MNVDAEIKRLRAKLEEAIELNQIQSDEIKRLYAENEKLKSEIK